MAETTTTRLGLRRWSADTDTWARTEFDGNNAAREQLLAAFTQGNATKGPPATPGRFYYDASTDSVYYDSGSRWVTMLRQADAVASLVLSGLVYDTTATTGAPAGTPNVFRRGDYVTVIVGGINRPSGATPANASLINIPAGFRPARTVPIELYSRPDRNYATATIDVDGNLRTPVSWGSGEYVYGTVTYPAP